MNEREVFIAALQRGSPPERAAFLDEVCREPGQRQQVERLLSEYDNLGSFLEAPPASPVATIAEPPHVACIGSVIGPYKLLQQIGEGGMGVVWMAEQTHPVQRKVALKVIKAGMDSRQVIARFEAERQALALMDHPNIAKVLDAGTIPMSAPSPTSTSEPEALAKGAAASFAYASGSEGRPYFVMELVKGIPLTKYCDEHHLTPRERLELFVPVCQAVQHAHQKGIIHRDLKPSNVMVCLYDGKPVPKVIDFGVAKATGPRLTEQTLFTEFGQVVGTLEYMSPEQAELNQLDIDTRSDIYSLGVLLYELLTGTTPLERKRFKEVAFMEVLRLIREEESPKPSTRLSTTEGRASIAANRGLEPKKLSGLVRGELDWIVMKTLEKDRNRRYETAKDFAADMQRYLNDEPVQACPPSALYRFRKFARRNKVALMTVALVALALVAGTVVSTWQAVRATRAEGLAQTRLDAETQAHRDAEDQRRQAETARKAALANLETARDAVHQLLRGVAQKELVENPRTEGLRQALLEKALKFYQGFLQEHSTDPSIRLDVGNAYRQLSALYDQLGRHADAEKLLQDSILILEPLVAELPSEPDYPSALAVAYRLNMKVLTNLQQDEKSEQAGRQAIALLAKLAAESPADVARQYHYRSAGILLDLAPSLDRLGRHREAEAAIREALSTYEKPDPSNPDHRSSVALAYGALAGVLAKTKGPGEAEEALRRAMELFEILVSESPNSPETGYALSSSRHRLGLMLAAKKQFADAEKELRAAVVLDAKLVAEFPKTTKYRKGLVNAHLSLGRLLLQMGQLPEAMTCYRQVIALNPTHSHAYNDLAWLLANHPEPKVRDPAQAITLAKKAVELGPKEGHFWNTLGVALYRVGDGKAAITTLEKSMELRNGGDSFDWFFLAMAHWKLDQKDQARTWYNRAVEWMEKNQPNHGDLRRFRAEAAELLGIERKQ